MAAQDYEEYRTEVDYSLVEGNPILSFLIVLDETESILDPKPGERQRFCYSVSGVGWDDPLYADLEELAFLFDGAVPKDQFANLYVTVDELDQNLLFGDDGHIAWEDQTNDIEVLGSILRLWFELGKVDGEMDLGFELTEPRPLGSVFIRLTGGGANRQDLAICGPSFQSIKSEEKIDEEQKDEEQSDTVVAIQESTISVPLTIVPSVHLGEASTQSCGLQICVTVPMEFGATAIIGEPEVKAGQASCQTCVKGPQ